MESTVTAEKPRLLNGVAGSAAMNGNLRNNQYQNLIPNGTMVAVSLTNKTKHILKIGYIRPVVDSYERHGSDISNIKVWHLWAIRGS